MHVYKGQILSVNKNNDVFSYLVEQKGKIVYVGNNLPNIYEKEKIIDLKDKALIPSFVDTHQHFASFALFHSGLNVMNASSNEEIQEIIKDFVSKTKQKTIICFGASPYSVKERRLICKDELDKVCNKKEIMVVKYDGHACIINSLLLNRLKDKLVNLRGYHEDTGEMNQEAFFVCSSYLTNSISIPQLVKNMQNAMDYEASKGITMVHSVSGIGFPLNLDINLEKWIGRSAQSGFKLRIYSQTMNTKVVTRRHLPRIGGCFECALDGCFGSQDAALNAPYNGTNDQGVLYYNDEKVIDFCKRANRLGLQIEMHAIGDKAFDQATKALKACLDDYPRDDHRHSIIHDCLPTKEGLEICEKYHICMPIQTSFIDWKQEPEEYLISILGEERTSKLNPTRDFLSHKIVIAGGSDAPCTDPDPIMWMHQAVNHTNKAQALTIQEALKMCTYNGYYISFDEKEYGSLEVGKCADMVILSKNPYLVEKEDIKNIKVEKTIINGIPYTKQNQSFVKAILKGIFSRNKI